MKTFYLVVVVMVVGLDFILGQEGIKEGHDTDEMRKDKPFWAARGRRAPCTPLTDETLDSPGQHLPLGETDEKWIPKLMENLQSKLLSQVSEDEGGESTGDDPPQGHFNHPPITWKRNDPRAVTLTRDLISLLQRQGQMKKKTQDMGSNTPFWPARG